MCGIAGIIKKKTITYQDKKTFNAMLKSIKHRGPDSSGFFNNSKIIIGMNRLSIIDIKNGKQPIEDKNNQIIFNGEIYNFKELKKKYLSREKFKTNTDTEVLLRGYNKYGISFFKKCNGIFAFCIYDNNKKKIILCRDPVGVKPLYVYFENDIVYFSSELKSFFKFKNIVADKDSIKQYLSSFYTFSPNCSLKKVFSLEPGSVLSIDENIKVKKIKYHEIKKIIFVKNKTLRTDIKQELTETVDRQLVSDAPIGLLLSSGLDSMCILSSLKQLNKLKNINTYTAIYDDKNVSEEKLIIKLSKKWGFKTNFIKIDAKSVVKNFDDYIKCYDDLEFMPNSFAMYYLCKKIKNKKVLLTGIGGDEIFLGYKTHIASNIKSYFKEKSHICNFLYKIKFLELYNENIERFLYGCSKSYLESFFLWRNIHKISEINTNFNTPKISNYKEIYKNYYRKINYKFKNYSKKKFFSYVDFSTWLVDHGLKLWDKAGMYSSIEIRVPYLDLEFLKKIFKNLENSRCKKIGFKQNLIDAYRQELPEEIINNPKKGFSVPLVMWMQNKKFKKLFINIIDNDNLILTDSYKNYLKEKILKVTNNQDAFKLWSTICLCRWLQINKLKI